MSDLINTLPSRTSCFLFSPNPRVHALGINDEDAQYYLQKTYGFFALANAAAQAPNRIRNLISPKTSA